MIMPPFRLGIFCLVPLLFVCVAASIQPTAEHTQESATPREVEHNNEEQTIKVQYLEIVTPSVNETCEVLAEAHGVVFGDPVAALGNARTAKLKDGGRIGVRAPMRATEKPIVRPYVLVKDIEAAVEAARAAGAVIALPPIELPDGHGTFSIYILGGIEHGLWQL